MLIAFPIAFLPASLVADVAAYFTSIGELWRVSYWLQIAGIVTALIAAVPGFIDYLFVVPPKSSGKKRAAQHGLLNVGIVVLFTFIWIYRQRSDASYTVIIALDLAGTVGLTFSGWLGGTLAYRNQIGVDHRYAFAGKWKEERVAAQGKIKVAQAEELKPNQMKLIHAGNRRIVVARTETNWVAFDDHCTHRGASLADGSLACGIVQCPWHGSQFDVKTGVMKAGPAKENISTYPLSEENGNYYLQL